MKVNVYVDGFNLYYRALKKTPGSKWLDLSKLATLLLGQHEVQRIRYFTARVNARNSEEQPMRQETYLRALRTIPNLSFHFGYFAEHIEERCRLVTPLPNGITHVDIIRTSEKGSDVNLATHLLVDASADGFEGAAVITNDSDLCTPILMARDYFKRKVVVLDPSQEDGESKELKKVATFYRKLRIGPILASQFPVTLHDKHGMITRPPSWDPPPPRPTSETKPEKS